MALHKEWLIPFARVIRQHGVKGPALGLGDQQTLFTPRYAAQRLQAAGLLVNPRSQVIPDHVHSECISFRSLLALLGVDDYSDIDLNGRAALRIDLGKPVPEKYYGVAGCVFDLGTLEHVFDIGEGFRNICRLLRPGGCVIHFSPITAFNHGLWNVTPQLFFGFYQLNDFEVLDHGVIFSPLFTLWSSLVSTKAGQKWERTTGRSRLVVRVNSLSRGLQYFCNFCLHPPRMYMFFAARKRSSHEIRTFYQV